MGSYKAAKEMYPILNKYDYKIVDTPNEDSPYYLEHFPPGEVGSLEMPRPKGIPLEEYGLQIFKDVRPEDIAGDIISHHIVNKDKYLSEKYKDFKTSTSLDVMKERYKYHKENFNEQRDFNSWSERTGYPELFRGYVFNQFDEETKNNLYSPKQKTVLNEIKEYITKKPKDFAQGGLTMNNQTQMAFALGGEAETRDPVSGNDVPPGSLPVEVRDDIPARLSEGEYVVPADVVRFFGVKFFEDIRMEAKKGLQQMDVDGRIGGEPIPPQMQMAQAPEQDIDAMIDAEMGNMNAGGLMSGYAEGAAVTAPSYTPGGGFGYGYGSQPMSAPQTMAPPAPVAPVITGGAEPVARQEPVGGCPEGTLWNGYLCAVNLSYNPNAGDLPDDPETTPVEKWYEEDGGKALVNPEEYIKEQFNKGSGTSDINPLVPKGAGIQLAFGIFDLVNKKSSISKAAAAYRLAEARDQIIEGSDLAKIGDQLFGKGDSLGKGLVASLSNGDWKLNSYARDLGFKNWEDSQSEGTVEGKSVQTTSRGKTTTAPMFTGITKKAAWKSLDKYLSFKIEEGPRKGQAFNFDPAELAELRDTIIYTDEDRGGPTGAGATANIISTEEKDGTTSSSTGFDFNNPLASRKYGPLPASAITREVTPISSSERARLSGNTSNSSNTSNNVGTRFSSRGKNKNKGGLITKRKKK